MSSYCGGALTTWVREPGAGNSATHTLFYTVSLLTHTIIYILSLLTWHSSTPCHLPQSPSTLLFLGHQHYLQYKRLYRALCQVKEYLWRLEFGSRDCHTGWQQLIDKKFLHMYLLSHWLMSLWSMCDKFNITTDFRLLHYISFLWTINVSFNY